MIETVNGYVCHNCSDVALAKRNIDPAHPKDDPTSANATNNKNAVQGAADAVTFGGNLAAGGSLDATGADGSGGQQPSGQRSAPGATLNILA